MTSSAWWRGLQESSAAVLRTATKLHAGSTQLSTRSGEQAASLGAGAQGLRQLLNGLDAGCRELEGAAVHAGRIHRESQAGRGMVAEVGRRTLQNAALAEQSSAGAEQMRALALDLHRQAARFRLP